MRRVKRAHLRICAHLIDAQMRKCSFPEKSPHKKFYGTGWPRSRRSHRGGPGGGGRPARTGQSALDAVRVLNLGSRSPREAIDFVDVLSWTRVRCRIPGLDTVDAKRLNSTSNS